VSLKTPLRGQGYDKRAASGSCPKSRMGKTLGHASLLQVTSTSRPLSLGPGGDQVRMTWPGGQSG